MTRLPPAPRVAMLERFAPDVHPRLRDLAEGLDLVFCASDSAEDRRAALSGAEYAVVRAVRMEEALLDHTPHLKLIHQWGTGTDGIPVAAARSRGVTVARCPGVNAPSVADLTIGLMLACLRRIPAGDARIRAGLWAAPDLYETGRDLTGARVGLIGFGAIGQAVAARLSGFDCEVLHHRASGGPGSTALDDVIASADVLSLHLPATAATRHLINADRIARMKPGAVLINTARGELVDENALCAALHAGQIGGAGLDVFEHEPLAATSPLREAPNVVFSAHSGGRTRDNFARVVRYWARNIRLHAAGEAISAGDLVG